MKERIIKVDKRYKNELIRCKNCYHHSTSSFSGKYYCVLFGQVIRDNDYCSWAEPKDVLEKNNDR